LSFALKKIFGSLLTNPLLYVLIPMVIGWLTLRLSRWRRVGWGLMVIGLVAAYVVFFGPFGQLAVAGLESRYRPLMAGPRLKAVKWIVVLSGGLYAESRGPAPWSCLPRTSLRRTLEGVRLARHLPGAKLVLTGGVGRGRRTEARLMAAVARFCGIAPDRIVIDEKPLDTEGQAAGLAARVGTQPMILVTSANHLPRAMALFRRAGVKVIAAPTDWRVGRVVIDWADFFIPQAANARLWRIALHEYLGRWWAWIRGRI
jgi:uncharacterized SAM-binding protein YcdF (DUF218 family)